LKALKSLEFDKTFSGRLSRIKTANFKDGSMKNQNLPFFERISPHQSWGLDLLPNGFVAR
jgi:hypothetical protein